MTDEERGRNIRFPQSLWDAIDEDAKRHKRSGVKQMETVLSIYYGLEDNEIDRQRLAQMRDSLSGGIEVAKNSKNKILSEKEKAETQNKKVV